MSESVIRLGVVGYGGALVDGAVRGRGRGLLTLASQQFPGVTAAAICDRDPASLERAKADFPQAAVFDSFERMLAQARLDALLVETPATHHAEFAIAALRKNIHVLSDIPCVFTLEEAWDLWAAQQGSSATYMTGANANLWGFIDSAVDLKKRGLLGKPYYVEAAYIHDVRNLWESSPWRETLPPIHYCTHSIGPVLRVIEEDFEWVSCFDTGSHVNAKAGQHDAMAALLRTPSNVVMRLLVSFINNYRSGGHHYRFFTTKGCFERTPHYRTFRKEPAENERTLFYSSDLYGYNNWTELPVDGTRPEYAAKAGTGHGGVDYAMMGMFFGAIRQGQPAPIGLREGLSMTIPGIVAAESARRGGRLMKIVYPWTAAQCPALEELVAG